MIYLQSEETCDFLSLMLERMFACRYCTGEAFPWFLGGFFCVWIRLWVSKLLAWENDFAHKLLISMGHLMSF
jgi:hypothetical protein